MPELQSGIVTFLFTDVEGSTRLWEADEAAMSVALARHDELLSQAIVAGGGTVFKTAGDAFHAVFPTSAAAIAAAVAAQRALAGSHDGELPVLKVRMAIHAGHAEARGGDYFGPPLNRVARLLATGHGGQILVSRAASELTHGQLPQEIGLRDLGEHALKDLQLPERIFQVVATGIDTDFQPLRTARLLVRNVPEAATPLIGREHEVAVAATALGVPLPASLTQAALRDQVEPTRLLTLTGPGGTGKTRLALYLANELGVSVADGAAFVPLAELTDPALVPREILAALGPGETRGEPSRDVLFAELRDRELLLILDNFEQIMAAAALVAELLTRCPRLRIIATSRERLSLRGEQELPLPPLALPELPLRLSVGDAALAGESEALERIESSSAVRLFVARARSVKPDFAITRTNAGTIAEICARLDGLPLAIELAAARLRLLSPQALLERLDARLDVLSRGPRDLPARQQTMRDTIAWSYDLLDPAEQRLFARLAIFAGGCTLEAADSVTDLDSDGGASSRSDFDLDVLESLADKSLLRVTEADEPRVTMLQTIRDYARERLVECGDHDVVARRHADYFLALAETSEPLLSRYEQRVWLDRLDREQANMRAAISWLRESGRLEEALRLGGALWRYWWLRGDIGEGRALLDSLLQTSDSTDPATRAKALNAAGILAESQGDSEAAEQLHRESLEISRRLGDARGVAWSLNNLGVVAIRRGNYERAQALLEENLAVAEQADDDEYIATALMDLGWLAQSQDDLERAGTLFERSLERFRAIGAESNVARALNNLGTMALALGETERARSLLTESLELHRGVGDRQGMAGTLNNLAEAMDGLGDFETAMDLYLESYALALEGGNELDAAIALGNLAGVNQRRGETGISFRRFREAWKVYRRVSDEEGIVTSLSGMAAIAASLGMPREAVSLLSAAGEGTAVAHPELDRLSEELRGLLGEEAFAAAWRDCAPTRIDDVVDRVDDAIAAVSPR